MSTTYLRTAEVAKLLRKVLKSNFPGTRFSVRSEVYSGGSSIDVKWIDGPSEADVDAALEPYRGSDFDGMIDLKTPRDPVLMGGEDGSLESVRMGVDFIFAKRSYSEPVFRETMEELASYYGLDATGLPINTWTGPFKGTEVVTGIPGSSDPNIPNGRWTLSQETFSRLRNREVA